ncbi:hypothetical protein BCR35DRAFT_324323 [Leucosporidium creatinivorum]|uniref:F-box domain-containing protein n=1 Tax=Leucosporidium creatinivorum TaxID=106004 RepID=A0A1Y2FW88_9BASI|nr:hypothetical protein BCR35DRAFT_324323 [Leucosporidium creatinivorum]
MRPPHPPTPAPAPAQIQTTLDVHSLRLHSLIQGAQHEGSNGLFFRGRVPGEILLEVASYLTEDLIPLTHVCVRWRRLILSQPVLWERLDGRNAVEVASFEAVERVRAVASRSRGHLKSLYLGFNLSGDRALEVMPVVSILRQLLKEIAQRDGGRALRELEVDLKAYGDVDDIEPAYGAIVVAAQFLEFSAVNITKLSIETRLRRFPGGAPFFAAMPSLEELTLTCRTEEPFAESRLPDFFSTSATIQDTQITTSALRKLTLSGPSLMDATFPSFPHLKSLDLYDTQVCNLYGLLSKCSSTLEKLSLVQIRSNPAINFQPSPADGSQKDLPPTLHLPYLTELNLCGYQTPFLWTAPTLTTSNFLIEAFSLKKVSFGEQKHVDEEWAMEEGVGPYEGYHTLTVEGLSTFFRDSPSLVDLTLAGTNVTPEILFSTLPNANSSLSRLVLGYTATDAVVDRLHTLVPNLKYLDVQSRGGTRVTLPALARLASRLRNSNSAQLSRWLAVWKLTLVTAERSPDPTLLTLRSDLRTLLLSLSPTQVSHLTSSLTLNDPPNALAFPVVKQEVINLAASPTPPSAGGGGKKPMPRPAAPQGIVDTAKVALGKWQRKREEEWAVEWCEATGGVELKFWEEEDDDDE